MIMLLFITITKKKKWNYCSQTLTPFELIITQNLFERMYVLSESYVR